MKKNSIIFPDKILFSTEIDVHIGLINYAGHVGNDSFLTLAHEMRIRFLRSLNYHEGDIEGFSIILTDAQLEFKSEVFPGDVLQCHIAVADMGRTRFNMYYKMCLRDKNNKLACVARTGIVLFNPEDRKIASLPQNFLRQIEK